MTAMTNHDRMNYWWRRAKADEARVKAALAVLDKAHDEFEQPNEADIRRALTA